MSSWGSLLAGLPQAFNIANTLHKVLKLILYMTLTLLSMSCQPFCQIISTSLLFGETLLIMYVTCLSVLDADHTTANGDTKTGTGKLPKTPPPERKQGRLATLRRLFVPWKWKRRKKPSEKIEKRAVGRYSGASGTLMTVSTTLDMIWSSV